MGNYKIEIEAVGNHGADRRAKQGEAINFGEAGPHNPDALMRECIDQLNKAGGVTSAKLTHWPDTTPIIDNLLTGVREHGEFGEAFQREDILEHFEFAHLADGPMRETSRPFCQLAFAIVRTLPRSAERTVALRKLLEGKDAAVRAARKLLKVETKVA